MQTKTFSNRPEFLALSRKGEGFLHLEFLMLDDSFPWSEFPDHYLTPGEIEEAFDEANAIAGEPANVPF